MFLLKKKLQISSDGQEKSVTLLQNGCNYKYLKNN